MSGASMFPYFQGAEGGANARALIARLQRALDQADKVLQQLENLEVEIDHLPEDADPTVEVIETPEGMKWILGIPAGKTGMQGVQGVPGVAGLQGVPGPQGIPGPEGRRGPAGERGQQGPRGERGEAGVGPAGPQGIQGERGQRGEQGVPGPQGERGLQGMRGPAGPAGPQGSPGERGETGSVGPAGPAGPQGERGFSGVAVETTGFVAFNITEDGVLQCSYTGDEAPDYYIDGNGHLILEI